MVIHCHASNWGCQFNVKIFFRNWIELNRKPIKLSLCRFISIISCFYTNFTSKTINYCKVDNLLIKVDNLLIKVKNLSIKVENLSIKVKNLSIQFKINWFKDRFDGTSIIDLSEGDNLSDNDNFLMILFGSLTSPKVRAWSHEGITEGR